MFFEKNNRFSYGKKVLIAPLDWGLGHATRCIPLIYNLLNNGATVFLAADGQIKDLLLQELPQVVFLPLKGYKVRYSKRPGWLFFTMLIQFPRLLQTVFYEHKWLKRVHKEHGFDAVISDNRPGLYNNALPCIYITHQLKIKTGNKFTERLLQKIHYHFINKFSQCWVTDNETNNSSLAGLLSHPVKLPSIPVTYIGPLSRFKKVEEEKKYSLLVLLSGPEPQRTIFEQLLLKELIDFEEPVLFVRGLPGSNAVVKYENKNIKVHNHLNASALNTAILQSKMVICRSGYTSVMDLVTLQQKAILVPTPGQTEQEYLGDYLHKKGLFYCVTQNNFSLTKAIEQAALVPFNFLQTENSKHEKVVADFLQNLKA